MKKIFVSVFLFVAIVSFGGIVASAHAQTASPALTPEQAAMLQQSLNALKTKLLLLQAQAAAQSGSQVSTPAVSGSSLTLGASMLSAQDIASLQNALTLLASALTSLQSELAANPQLAAGREGLVLSALKGIGTTLTAIGTTIGNTSAGSVAYSGTPKVSVTPSAGTSGPTAQAAPSAGPSTQGAQGSLIAPTTPAPTANATPETAQVQSIWSLKNLNWPLTIVIILVLAVIALWLFWPGDEDKTKKAASAPKPTLVREQQVNRANSVNYPNAPKSTAPLHQTPLASAMASPTPADRSTAAPAPMKTVPPQPPQQQRKPA